MNHFVILQIVPDYEKPSLQGTPGLRQSPGISEISETYTDLPGAGFQNFTGHGL